MVHRAREEEEWPRVRYLLNYMDIMENVPNDLQRQLSLMLDLDATCQNYVREFDKLHEVLAKLGSADTTARRQALTDIQNTLIIMQDIGDEKLQIMQTIQDIVEKRARELEIDYRNSKPRMEQENNKPLNISYSNSTTTNSKNSSNNIEKSTRRGRRPKGDTSLEQIQTADTSVLSENQSSNLPSTSNGTQRTSAASAGKKKKRKSFNNQHNKSQEEASPPVDDQDIEADEPRYCICNQISYGKMVLCDNDACDLEWFHFPCVNLTADPRGKWYCPICRGSKPTIMKPKSQFR